MLPVDASCLRRFVACSAAPAAASALLLCSLACRSFAQSTPPPEKLPGVDLGGLDGDALKSFFDVAGKEPSPCKAGESLLAALRREPACLHAQYAGRYLARLERADLVPSEVQQYYEWRYTAKPARIDLSAAPLEGDARAPVTIVEFADFECPHCKALQPDMAKVLATYGKEVKIYFKNFPLGQHERAMDAAVAALAAGRQGKFWPMEAALFENQDHLEPADVDRYAQRLGLDLARFHADQADQKVKDLVLADRDEAKALNLEGTPSVFINGVEVHGPKTFADLADWVDEALNRLPARASNP